MQANDSHKGIKHDCSVLNSLPELQCNSSFKIARGGNCSYQLPLCPMACPLPQFSVSRLQFRAQLLCLALAMLLCVHLYLPICLCRCGSKIPAYITPSTLFSGYLPKSCSYVAYVPSESGGIQCDEEEGSPTLQS